MDPNTANLLNISFQLLALGVCRHFAKRSTAAVETAALVLVLTKQHVGRGPKRDVLVRAAHVIFIPAAIIKVSHWVALGRDLG